MRIFVITFLVLFYSCLAWAELPNGNVTIAGDISISSDTQTMTINQQSDQAIIEWNSFNIGENNTVTFQQPSSSASALNRVISGNPTTLAGALNANGKVFVVNENGVYFTPTSTINAHSFAASTLSLSNDNFLNNIFSFSSSNQSLLKSVINKGSITTLDGGFTALLGGAINNEGTINANLGKLGLGAGKEITLDLSGDKFLQVAVPLDTASTVVDNEGNTLDSLISHSGTTNANTIELDVGSVKNILSQAVNIPGSMVASSAEQKNGKIILSGGGTTAINGSLQAKSQGEITITSDHLSLNGTLDVSDDLPGSMMITSNGALSVDGKLLANSSSQKGGSIKMNASSFQQIDGSVISANGIEGGSIYLSADNIMSSGTFSASGSTTAGGQIDIEGKNTIRLLSADILASGHERGGLVRIGGAFQGGYDLTRTEEQEQTFLTRWGSIRDLENTKIVFVNDGSLIDVSATTEGGTAVIWSDLETTMLGSINANALQGGSVEISSKDTLRYLGLQNITIGNGGHLLLDPKNITIGDTAGSQNWSLVGVIGDNYTGANDLDFFGENVSAQHSDVYFGERAVISGDGTKLAVIGKLQSTYKAVYLFTFDDTNFSNATYVGKISDSLASNTKSLTVDAGTGGFTPIQLDLDSDGDRLVVNTNGNSGQRIRSLYPSSRGQYMGNQDVLYTIKFSDTNFSNPEVVGIMTTERSTKQKTDGYGDLIASNQNDLHLDMGSYNGFSGYLNKGSLSLNGDGSRLVIGVPGNNTVGSPVDPVAYLISFSDTNFSSPSVTGKIGVDHTGAKDLDISSDATITQNRLLNSTNYQFGQSMALSSDAKQLVGLDNKRKAIHLFSFSDGDFSSPTYEGSITEQGDTTFTYGKSADILTTGTVDGFSLIDLSGNGTRLVVSPDGNNNGSTSNYGQNNLFDLTINFVGFSDNNFNNAELKQVIDAHDFKPVSSGTNLFYNQWRKGSYPSGSVSMDDTGKLVVFGVEGDEGAGVNSYGGYDEGAVYMIKENVLSGAYSYTDSSGDDVVINATELKALLDANVNVTLQANTDITVDAAITTTGTGTLSLHAGRDVDINKSINTSGNLAIIASDTTANNVVSAQRDSGTGDILAAYESDGTTAISLTASDLDITLNNGSGVTNASMGNIELATITATTGTLQSANFSASGAGVSDKTYDGNTSATVSTTGSVSGLTLVGSDLSVVNTASFTSSTAGSAKDATVDYDISGYLSSAMDVTDTSSTAITESVTAAITEASSSGSSSSNSNNSSEENNIAAVTSRDQRDIVENMIGDINKIVPFVSVDAIVGSTMSLQLAREANIQSAPNTEGLGIQSL